MATTQTCPFGQGFDFTNPDILEKGIPVTEFAELRKTAPVWWNEQPESIFDDGGYWVITATRTSRPSPATATCGRPTARASSCACPTARRPISWS